MVQLGNPAQGIWRNFPVTGQFRVTCLILLRRNLNFRDILFVNPEDGTPESFIRDRKA
jgi:hypothetical protein